MPSAPAKTKRRRAQIDPVRGYAEQVLDSSIVAGPYVRLACQRHLEDLGREEDAPLADVLDEPLEVFGAADDPGGDVWTFGMEGDEYAPAVET